MMLHLCGDVTILIGQVDLPLCYTIIFLFLFLYAVSKLFRYFAGHFFNHIYCIDAVLVNIPNAQWQYSI